MLKVSAPGKVILFGDHSVVYGKTAIAAAISLRTYLTCNFQSSDEDTDRTVSLEFPNLGFSTSWKLSELPLRDASKAPQTTLDEDIVVSLDILLKHLSETKRVAAFCFLYLYVQILTIQTAKGGSFEIRSAIPIGAGLGSSASVSVVLATAFLIMSKKIDSPLDSASPGSSQAPAKDILDLINRWAFVGELCIHGSPSGVDNTVSTYGNAVRFQRNRPHVLLSIPSLPLLLTNTNVSRSTKAQVEKVARSHDAFPFIIDPILEAMDQISLEALSALADGDIERIGHMIELNHGLLRFLDVSHPTIETIVQINTVRGWTKLTGAGGGGCCITLLRPGHDVSSNTDGLGKSSNSVTDEWRVSLGAAGVGIHGPNDALMLW